MPLGHIVYSVISLGSLVFGLCFLLAEVKEEGASVFMNDVAAPGNKLVIIIIIISRGMS